MKFQPLVNYTGSKRKVSEQIVDYFPDNINTYYEPFVGGGSILFQLFYSNKKVNKYIASDADLNLISLFEIFKKDPKNLLDYYEYYHSKWVENPTKEKRWEIYSYIRDRFNKERKTEDFFFLIKNSINNLIRYNQNTGNFNAACDFPNKNADRSTIEKSLLKWKPVLEMTTFIHQDCRKILSSINNNDYIYCYRPFN